MSDLEGRALVNWCSPGTVKIGALEAQRLDLQVVKRLIDVHRVGPWLYARAGSLYGLVGEHVRETAVRSLVQRQIDDRVRYEVLAALGAAGLTPIPLKGTVWGTWLYDKAWQRPAHDLDVLMPPGEHAAAARVLSGLGFEGVARTQTPRLEAMSHESAYWRGAELPVELHKHITQPQRFAVPLGELLARSEAWTWEGLALRRLSGGDQLLHAAIHAAHHKYLLPLVGWIDMALLLERGFGPEALRLARKYDLAVPFGLAVDRLAAMWDLPEARELSRPLGFVPRLVFRGLRAEGLPRRPSRGSIDTWYGFWLIQGARRRLAFALAYGLRWLIDRPRVGRRQTSRQLRSRWGWRSERLALFGGFSTDSESLSASPQTSQ